MSRQKRSRQFFSNFSFCIDYTLAQLICMLSICCCNDWCSFWMAILTLPICMLPALFCNLLLNFHWRFNFCPNNLLSSIVICFFTLVIRRNWRASRLIWRWGPFNALSSTTNNPAAFHWGSPLSCCFHDVSTSFLCFSHFLHTFSIILLEKKTDFGIMLRNLHRPNVFNLICFSQLNMSFFDCEVLKSGEMTHCYVIGCGFSLNKDVVCVWFEPFASSVSNVSRLNWSCLVEWGAN